LLILFLMMAGAGMVGARSLEAQTVQFFPASISVAVPVGYSTSQTVVIENTGAVPLVVSGVSIMGTNANQFSDANNCTTSVAPGSTCSVNVVFTPASPGNYTASLSFADNATGSPQTVPLNGIGNNNSTSVTIIPAGPLNFTAAVNTASSPQGITVKNVGSSELVISSVTLSGSGASAFQVTNATCFDVNPGGVCGPGIVFEPTATGTFNATITITDNAADSPQTVALVGVASAPTGLTAHFSKAASVVGSGFSRVARVAVDGLGNVYVTDSGANVVKEIVAVNGQVSASSSVNVIGSGFSNPMGVAVDANGDVYVADAGNHAVKEIVAVNGQVSASSAITTIGSGFNHPSGVGVDLSGNVYVADTGNNAVKEIVAVNGQVSAASAINSLGSGFTAPADVAVDEFGNVFVADTGNQAVEVLQFPSFVVSSVSGSTLMNPVALSVNRQGIVFVADATLEQILQIHGDYALDTGGFKLPVAIAISPLNLPSGIAADNTGNLFLADESNGSVEEYANAALNVGATHVGVMSPTILVPFTFDNGGTLGSWHVYTQGATGLDFNESATGTTCSTTTTYAQGDSCSVAVQFSPLYAGWRIGAVQLLDTSGALVATAYIEGVGVAPQIVFPSNTARFAASNGSSLEVPQGAYVTAAGNVFVADEFRGLVEVNAVNGIVSASSTTTTLGPGNGSLPTVDGAGNAYLQILSAYNAVPYFYELQASNGQIIPNTMAIGAPTYIPPNVNAQIFSNDSVGFYSAVDASGDTFASNSNTDAVEEVTAINGRALSTSTAVTAVSSFSNPLNVALDGPGNLYVPDAGDFITMPGSQQVYVIPFATAPSLSFPTLTPVGSVDSTDGTLSVTVANDGNEPLVFPVPASGHNPSLSGNFSWQSSSTCAQTGPGSDPFTLAPGARCHIDIQFLPEASGVLNGALVLTDNALNASAPNYVTQTVKLTGIGAASTVPTVTLSPPGPLSFSTTVGATSDPQIATLTNTGSLSVNITGVTLGGTNPGDFAIASNGCGNTLSAGASCMVSITFTPASVASFAATLSIVDNATGSPQTLALNGSGAATSAPAASLAPTTLSFTAASGTTSTAQMATLTNTGSAALNISSIVVSGASFADTTSCGSTLAAGASCMISVTFTPSAAASYSGSLTVSDNASGSPQSITLSGTGLTSTYGLSASPMTQAVAGGSVATYTLTITPQNGAYASSISLSASGLPGGAIATFSPATIVPGAAAATSSLTIQTVAATADAERAVGVRGWRMAAPMMTVAFLLLLPRRRLGNALRGCLLVLVGVGVAVSLLGCGGAGFGSPKQGSTNYNITIDAVSGTQQQTITVQLTVQ
jgi:sugar lactone lactonase YvrE